MIRQPGVAIHLWGHSSHSLSSPCSRAESKMGRPFETIWRRKGGGPEKAQMCLRWHSKLTPEPSTEPGPCAPSPGGLLTLTSPGGLCEQNLGPGKEPGTRG